MQRVQRRKRRTPKAASNNDPTAISNHTHGPLPVEPTDSVSIGTVTTVVDGESTSGTVVVVEVVVVVGATVVAVVFGRATGF